MIKRILLLVIIFASVQAHAQPYKTIKPYKPYKWMFGVLWNGLEDDGQKFSGMFDVNRSWNIKPYPTALTIDRYFVYGWSAELGMNFGQYTPNKLVNGSTDVSGINLSADFHGKYSFYNLYAPRARWIDPYVVLGPGITYRTGTADLFSVSANAGGGVNFWFVNWMGVRLSATAKFCVFPGFWNTPNNYLQYNAGLVFRTPDESSHKNPNSKKRHKWTNKQPKKYRQKGGH